MVANQYYLAQLQFYEGTQFAYHLSYQEEDSS